MEKTLTQTPSSCLKIVLFGPESTGKTTLAKQLAVHFETEWVPEYMRSYLEEKWDTKKEKITKKDLLPIAIGQIKSENKLSKRAKNLLFCDTNLVEIEVYSKYYYDGFCPPEILEANKTNNYHLYLLMQIDTPWIFDNLRDRPYERSSVFSIFETTLNKKELPYAIIDGKGKQRLQNAIKAIASTIN